METTEKSIEEIQRNLDDLKKDGMEQGQSEQNRYHGVNSMLQEALLHTETPEVATQIIGMWAKELEGNYQSMGLEVDPELPLMQQKVSEIIQEQQRIWHVIAETADKAAEISHGLMAKDIRQTVNESVQKADQKIQTEVHQAADQLFEEMHQVNETEKEYGMSPETWKNFGNEHHTKIKKNLQELSQNIDDQMPSLVKQSCQKVVDVFKQGIDYLQIEQERLASRDQKIENDMAEIKNILKAIQTSMQGNLEMDKNNANAQLLEQAGNLLLKQAEQYKKDKKAVRSPMKIYKMFQAMQQKVTEVKHTIQDFPGQVKKAVQNKLFDVADNACRKVASVFDNAIQYLEERRNKILALSPKVGIETEKEQTVPEAKEEKNVEREFTREELANQINKKYGTDFNEALSSVHMAVDHAYGVDVAVVPKDLAQELDQSFKEEYENKIAEPQSLANSNATEKQASISDSIAYSASAEPEHAPTEQELNEIPSVDKLGNMAEPKEIYFAYLNNVMRQDPKLKLVDADTKIAEELLKSKYKLKTKQCLTHSPALKNLNLAEKNTTVHKIVQEVEKKQSQGMRR